MFNNTGGTLEAANGITLDTQNLNNTSGVIQNLNASALNINASQTVTNNSNGFIGSNGQLTLNAAALDNNGSHLYAQDTLTLRSNGAITNRNGRLQTRSNLDLSAAGALDNWSGSIEAKGTFNLSAASLDNSFGRIANTGTAASTLNAAVINNAGGTLGSNGDLTLNTGTLLNTQQALIFSGNTLTLNAANQLSNNQSKIYAFGNLNFNRAGANFDNTAGDISSSGSSYFNVGSVHNQSGSVTSGTDITLAANSFDGNGRLIANRNANLALQGSYIYRAGNLFGANGNLSLSVADVFTNQTAFEAPGNLTINATHITNDAGASINANQTTLNAAGNILNNGRIDGSSIFTSSNQLTNNAAIIGNNIQLSANTLVNQNGSAIIAATNNINLWVGGQLSNTGGAEIYSMGDINIAANSSGARTAYLLNQSSLIDAGGSINVTASSFDNIRPVIAVSSAVRSVAVQTLARPPITTITNGGFFAQNITGLNPSIKTLNTIDSFGNASTVHYESISSAYAAIQYSTAIPTNGGNGRRSWAGFTSQTLRVADIVSTVVLIGGSQTGGDAYMVTLTNGTAQIFDRLDGQGTYYDVSYYPGFDPNVHIHPTQLRTLSHPFTTLNEGSRTITTTITDQVITSGVAPQAQMRASGNININIGSTLNNYTSTIAAGNTLSIVGPGSVNNQALSLTTTVDTSGSSSFYGGYSVGNGWGGSYWQSAGGSSSLVPTSSVSSSTAYSSILSGGSGAVIHAGVVKNNAGGSSTQIIGSTLGNTPNAASITGSSRSAVQSAAGNTAPSLSGSSSALNRITGAPAQAHARVAAINLAPVALPNITLPTSALYTQHRDPGHSYLIETDHRFTDYKSYTSSDYLLSRLSMDPSMAQKRLGDGFYEQKLISDQITQLTGRRFVGQYTSTEDQTRALMDSSVGAAQQLKLSTGIALSKEQAAALTQDIVWMVEEQITLADGTSTTALVPRVYLSAQHAIDLSPDGAVIAAEVIDIRSEGSLSNTGVIKSTRASMIAAQDILNKGSIQSSGDLLLTASRDISNISGSISGRRVSLSAGNNLLNSTASLSIGTRASGSEQNSSTGANGLGSFIPVDTGQASAYNTLIGNIGSITASDTLSLEAGNTLSILGASLSAGGNAQLKAGNQLIVNTLTTQSGITSGGPYKNDSAQTQNIRSSIQAGNNLSLNSGGDMQLTAVNLSAGRSASLISGGNLTLDTAKDITSHNQSAGRNINQAYDETVLGTNLKAGGNITLAATNVAPVGVASATNGTSKGNINLMSANLTSDTGKLTIIADNNINIGTTAEKHTSLIQTYSESSGFMSSSSSTNRTATSQTYAIGSSLSADSINIKSGKDINITGSSIAATNDVMLDAGNNLNILAATSYNSTSSYSRTTSSGFMSNGGLSITYGDRESTDKFDSSNTLQSQNRSMVGSINGNLILKAKGNALISGSDILAGQDINVLASDITINSGRDQSTSTEQHKYSQSGLTIALSNPVINAVQTGQQMQQAAKQTTDKRIQALAAVNVALAANSTYDAVSQNPSQAGGIKVSVSIGSSSSESRSTQTSDKAIGSTVKAGGNLNLVATAGKGEEGSGNITIQGSDIKAGNNISLAADNTINLLADQSTASQTSSNNSSSASIGLSFGVGKSGAGLSLDIAASRARGNADGNDIGNTNTHLNAGNQLSIKSGGDTNLKGAVANGKQIIADIGGNLNIESLQDKSTYQGTQESAGFSASIPIMGTGGGGSLSASQSNINSNYASVTEQSGFKAGDGGFQVAVRGNTTLIGAVIASSDTAITDNQNTFSTGGFLTQTDIQNTASYQADASGFSAGTGSMLGASGGVASDNGNASSTTKSGIGVSTKTDTTQAIKPIFDAAKVTADVNAQVQITQSFSQQAPKAVASFAGKQAADLRVQSETAKQSGDTAKAEQLANEATKWDEGGIYRVALHTVSSALSGGVDGAVAAATTANAAPLMDQLQNKVQETLIAQGVSPEQAKTISQGLAEVTSAAIGNAVSGTQGAATAVTVDTNNRQLDSDEKAAIAQKANIDKAAKERLTKAACYETKCWEQYPEGSPEREQNFVGVMEAVSLIKERDWVKSQQAQGLFKYTTTQQVVDKFQSKDLPVVMNATKVVVGALSIDAGLTICSTGSGCAMGGGLMVAYGSSNVIEGVSGLKSGYEGNGNTGFNPLRTGFNQLSPAWGNIAYDTLDLAVALGTLRSPVTLKTGPTDGINRPESMFGVTVPRLNNATLNPITKLPLPYGTTSSILYFGVGVKANTLVNDLGGN